MNFILLIMLLVYSVQGDDDDVEYEFPAPKLQGSNATPEVIFIGSVNGCVFNLNKNKSILCNGMGCKRFSTLPELHTDSLQIKTTGISVFQKLDLFLFSDLKRLDIEFNLDLVKIEPGCFQNMTKLTNMSISFNQNLKTLDQDIFKGLINLKQLYMLKNGFTKVFDVTRSLSPTYVPSLLQLYLNENLFRNILQNDFCAMAGSQLKELEFVLCQIEYIHPESFNPLKNLQTLRLGQNQFNETTIEKVIYQTILNHIPLKQLILFDVDFRREPPMNLLKLIAQTNITHLSLSRNTFDNLNEDSFPEMPNIIVLDLSNCYLLDISPGTFLRMPKLKTLYLNDNRLPSISPGIVLKQLRRLDISGNSGNPISRSYFRVDDNIFMDMKLLIQLEMRNNLITQLTEYTFAGLDNLRYLGLQNATIFGMDPGSFKDLKSLQYLNLENNQFSTRLTAEVFKGMNELKTLLLGGCSIDNLFSTPSPFHYLTNLTYLGLAKNSLYTVSPTIYLSLVNLKSLDLSVNKLTEWNERIFSANTINALDLSQNKFKTITESMLNDFEELSTLNLEGNPFTCDCVLYPAARWIKTHNFSVKSMFSEDFNAKCVNPDEWGQISIVNYLLYLQLNSEDCDVSNSTNKTVLISVLSVFVAIITVLSILGYVYRLHIRHWILLSRMAFRRYIRSKRNKFSSKDDEIDYIYDAFISYSNEDQDFVTNLVSMLENNEPYFKLCVYERDFRIGSAISESVLQSVASSKKTLLIISDSFAKSQWCRWEAKLAEHHHLFFRDSDMKGPRGTLLMILLAEVTSENMTPTLQYLLKTRIYLEWNTKPDEQAVFWEKLRKMLSSPNNGLYQSSMTISET